MDNKEFTYRINQMRSLIGEFSYIRFIDLGEVDKVRYGDIVLPSRFKLVNGKLHSNGKELGLHRITNTRSLGHMIYLNGKGRFITLSKLIKSNYSVPEHFVVHHLIFDHSNNDKTNLILMDREVHNIYHGKIRSRKADKTKFFSEYR